MKMILRYGDPNTWGSIPGVARSMGCSFLDTSQIGVFSDIDGVRFDLSEHRKLGQAGEGSMVTAQLTDLGEQAVEMVTRKIRQDGNKEGILVYGYKFRPLGLGITK